MRTRALSAGDAGDVVGAGEGGKEGEEGGTAVVILMVLLAAFQLGGSAMKRLSMVCSLRSEKTFSFRLFNRVTIL